MKIYNSYDPDNGLDFDFYSTCPAVFRIVTDMVFDAYAKAVVTFRASRVDFNGELVQGLQTMTVHGRDEEQALENLLKVLKQKFSRPKDRTHWEGCWRVHPECCYKKVVDLEGELEDCRAALGLAQDATKHWKAVSENAAGLRQENMRLRQENIRLRVENSDLKDSLSMSRRVADSWEERAGDCMKEWEDCHHEMQEQAKESQLELVEEWREIARKMRDVTIRRGSGNYVRGLVGLLTSSDDLALEYRNLDMRNWEIKEAIFGKELKREI